jgi:hypothetical protein
MDQSYRFLNKVVVVTYFLLILCIALYNYIKPYYSYDLIPYTAATISLEQSDPVKVHELTYKSIKDSIPNQIFNSFTTGTFGETMVTNSVSFNQQLNYYNIKPLYIYLIFILHQLGLGIVNAIHLISVLSYIGICILLYLFIKELRSGSGLIGITILSILLVCQPLILIAGRNTPDTFSAFVITLSLYLLLRSRLKLLSGVLLVLSITIRPDNLIISSLLLLYFGLFSPKQYRLKLVHTIYLLLASAIGYFAINHFEHAYSWKTLFTSAFLHFIELPAEVTVHLSLKDYFKVLLTNGIKVLNTHMFQFIVIGLIGLITSASLRDSVYNHLVKITLGVMVIYFLLFPSTEVDRYFITEYLIILIATLNNVCSKDMAIASKIQSVT